MIKYVLLACVISSAAIAQPAEYQLKVTPPELDTISEGLQTQPFGKVAPLMNKLRAQVIEQQPKPDAPKAEPPKATDGSQN